MDGLKHLQLVCPKTKNIKEMTDYHKKTNPPDCLDYPFVNYRL